MQNEFVWNKWNRLFWNRWCAFVLLDWKKHYEKFTYSELDNIQDAHDDGWFMQRWKRPKLLTSFLQFNQNITNAFI